LGINGLKRWLILGGGFNDIEGQLNRNWRSISLKLLFKEAEMGVGCGGF
jgi:hypothetical protein